MSDTKAPDAASRTQLRWPQSRTWADIAVLLGLATIGLVGFSPSFGEGSFLLPAFGGLAVGALAALAASVLRLGVPATVLVAVVAYFLFGTPFAVPQQGLFVVLPTLQSLLSLAVGAVHGWADIVTLRTPVGAPQYILVLPYVATWLVAFVSTTLAARWLAQRPRAAWRFGLALIGPFAIYLASILIGTDDPFQAGIRGTGFAAIALIWLGWRRRPAASSSPSASGGILRRRIVGSAVVVVGAVILGGGAGFWLAPPADQRFVLRDEIEPPFDPLQYPSPLAGFRHYTKQVTDETMFTVEGLEPGDRIRIATLDSFTGKLWNVTDPVAQAEGSGSFDLVGRNLPGQRFVTGDTRTGVTFTIEDYDDVWLPSIGYPEHIEFLGGEAADSTDDLRYNVSTGAAVLTSGLSSGDRYRVDAVVQRPMTAADLADVAIATVELSPVEGSPDIVTVKAQEFAGSGSSAAAQLEAIRTALVSTGYLSHGRANDSAPSRAGHGADRMIDLLEANQMVGDEEQYASAFALMARSLGHPARVVMGFAPEIASGSTVAVTGDDVTAWVEVAFDRTGWVAFDPTPDETDIPQDQTPKPQSEPQPQVRQPPLADADDEDLLTPVELEKSDEEGEDAAFRIPGWVYVVGASILIPLIIVFVPMLIVALIKARRRRRRMRAAAGHDRVAGAWDELIDRFSELGYDVPSATTRVGVARHLQQQIPAETPVELGVLAVRTDEAVFSGRDVPDEQSQQVWSEAQALVAAARRGISGIRRFLARYRVRTARDWAQRVSTRGGSGPADDVKSVKRTGATRRRPSRSAQRGGRRSARRRPTKGDRP